MKLKLQLCAVAVWMGAAAGAAVLDGGAAPVEHQAHPAAEPHHEHQQHQHQRNPSLKAAGATHSIYNLSITRGAMCAATLAPDTACFGGGGVAGAAKGSPPSDVVDCFNTTSKVWSTFKLPSARGGSSTSGGWLSGPQLAFFGAGGGSTTAGTVDLLSATSKTWLPSLAKTLNHEFTSCAGTGFTVACAGGQGLNKSDPVIPSATDVWTLNAAGAVVSHSSAYVLSEPRKKLASAAQGHWIAFATGYSDAGKAKNTGYSDTWDLLDTSTGQWTHGTLPSGEGRQYGTAVGCGGKLVFGGGQVAGGRSKAVDIFDTATAAWSNATLTVSRSNLAAACAKDRYAVFAGGQIPGRDTVDVLDTATGVWGTLDPLNYGRGWLTGSSAGNCAVFAGGDGRLNHSSVDAYCFE